MSKEELLEKRAFELTVGEWVFRSHSATLFGQTVPL